MNPYEFATIVGSAVAVLGILITWMSRRFDKLDAEIKEVSADANEKWMSASARMDTMIAAINARHDQQQAIFNARHDQQQATIIRLLEKIGK